MKRLSNKELRSINIGELYSSFIYSLAEEVKENMIKTLQKRGMNVEPVYEVHGDGADIYENDKLNSLSDDRIDELVEIYFSLPNHKSILGILISNVTALCDKPVIELCDERFNPKLSTKNTEVELLLSEKVIEDCIEWLLYAKPPKDKKFKKE